MDGFGKSWNSYELLELETLLEKGNFATCNFRFNLTLPPHWREKVSVFIVLFHCCNVNFVSCCKYCKLLFHVVNIVNYVFLSGGPHGKLGLPNV